MGQPPVRCVDELSSLHHIDLTSSQHVMSKSTKNGVHTPKKIPLNAKSFDKIKHRTSGDKYDGAKSGCGSGLQPCALELVIQTIRRFTQCGSVRVRTPETDGKLLVNNSENVRSFQKVLSHPRSSNSFAYAACSCKKRHRPWFCCSPYKSQSNVRCWDPFR